MSLADYRGRWLVLVFYPRDFSLVCPTELIGLSQRFDEFAAQNCELLGISCDSVESHERWIATPRSARRTRGPELSAGERPRRIGRAGLRRLPGARSPGGARAVHHRPRGPRAIPGRPQPERRPAEPGSLACAGRLAVGRTVPRGLDGRRPDDRPVSGDPAGSYFSHYQIEAEAGSGTFATVLSCTRPSARSVGGAQGLQARLLR